MSAQPIMLQPPDPDIAARRLRAFLDGMSYEAEHLRSDLHCLLGELERLRVIERRALSEADHDDTQGNEAHYILTGKTR